MVLGLVAAASFTLTACTSPDAPAPATPGRQAPEGPYELTAADADEIRLLMDERAQAVLAGDREAFVSTIDDYDVDLVAEQATVFDNLQRLPITDLTYDVGSRTGDPESIPGGDPLARPSVVEHLGMAGVLDHPIRTRQLITFVRREGAWVVGRESPAPSPSPFALPWTGGPIEVDRSQGFLVVADEGARPRATAIATELAADLARVADVLDRDVDDALIVDATSYGRPILLSERSRIEARAVTYPLPAGDDTPTGRAGTAIKINPDRVAEILGDRTVMRHELTHLLVPGEEALPIWMTEGIAEYVGTLPATVAEDRESGYARKIDLSDRRPRLVDTKSWGDDPPGDYLVARASVEYLVERDGVDRFLDMLDALESADQPDTARTTDRALRQFYGIGSRAVARAAFAKLRS